MAAAPPRPGTGAVVAWLCVLSSVAPRARGLLRATPPGGAPAPAAPERTSRCPREDLNETMSRGWELRNKADIDGMRETCKAGPLDVLLLGDSITERWVRPFFKSYDYSPLEFTDAEKRQDGGDLQSAFGPQRRVAVAAIGGDRSTDLLWRLRAGGLGEAVKQCAPRVVHVIIGTNDLGLGATPAQVGESYRQLVDELLALRPDSRLTLQLIMPRRFPGIGEHFAPKPKGLTSLKWAACPDAEIAMKESKSALELDHDSSPGCAVLFPLVSEVNRMIDRVASELSASGHDVGSLDCASFLTKPKGKLRSFEFPDLFHPNRPGYDRWSQCLRSVYQ